MSPLQFLTADEVAERLDVSRRRALEIVALCGLPARPAGVFAADLEAWRRLRGGRGLRRPRPVDMGGDAP